MADRYTAHDYDAAWQVWDNVEQRSVGGSFTEKAALAEAARLNAQAPKRAKSVVAWALISQSGTPVIWTMRLLRRDAISTAEIAFKRKWSDLRKRGWRVGRVRITEISKDDSHG